MSHASIAVDPRIRLPLERALVERLAKHMVFAGAEFRHAIPNPETLRRQLLGRAVRLTDAMAPAAVQSANAIRDAFGLSQRIELYQSAGRENAAMHLLREPMLMEIQGRLLSLLDGDSLKAVIGHEVGHFIAHGPDSPFAEESALATLLVLAEGVPPELSGLASSLSMARELTADRYGLLAARDLDAVLRLEMVATTGLPADVLGSDTTGYLAQCRELVEMCLASGERAHGLTHPEHGVRAWAAWLFSESDLYRELTGHGPGTRAIADVDALIARVLEQPELDGSFQYLEAPPVELHELALSAAVLVGVADGNLSDEETEILERTFASLVPGWRSLLDPNAAGKRFEELSPVARSFGPSIMRPLFNLLMHVLTADGVAHEQELRRVQEIGALLGAQDLFESLLRPVLVSLEVERREAVSAQPLPVRPQDAALALDAYLAAIVRRGGSQTTLRRMLRLLGVATRDPEALDRLVVALSKASLTHEADLAKIGLDEQIVLTVLPTAARAASVVRPAPDALKRAIARLRDELVSGDGNSPSVRLREIRPGRSFDLAALSKVSVGHGERCLALVEAGRRTVLLTGAQIGQSKDAQTQFRQLTELRREHAARREETGARDLYLGTGLVCGAVDGYVVRAPLLMYPVELLQEGQGGIALATVADEAPAANQAVFRLIHHKAGLSFPEDLAEKLDAMAADPAQGMHSLVEHLRSIGIDVFGEETALHPLDPLSEDVYSWKGRRLARESCAVIGLFPQSSSDLLEDYSGLLSDLDAAKESTVDLLASANSLLSSALRLGGSPPASDATPAADSVALVIPADPSQVEAIRLSRANQAAVVDGPPGTGKSQVIVNLVADALARGERIAVVSEKRAALDVVANRLAGAGLGDLIGVVHDVHEDRKPLFRKIQQRLEAASAPAAPSTPISAEDPKPHATAIRQRIEHLRIGESGEPRLGEFAAYAAGIKTNVPKAMPDLRDLSSASAMSLSRIALACRPWRDLLVAGSAWRPTEPATRRSLAGTTPQQRADMASALAHAASTAAAVEALATSQGMAPAQSAASMDALMAANKALGQLKTAESLGRTLLESPQDRSAALLALRAEWMSESDAWQSEPAPVRLKVDDGVEADVLLLLAKSQSFLRFLTPAWWSAKGRVTQKFPALWPAAVGRPIDSELLRGLHRRLRLSTLWKRFDEAVDTPDVRLAFAGDARQVFSVLDQTTQIADAVRQLRQARTALELLNAWHPDDIDGWQKIALDRVAAATAFRKHATTIASAREVFFGLDTTTSASALRQLHSDFVGRSARAAELDAHLAEAACEVSTGPVALAACADAEENANWQELVLKAWAVAVIEKHASKLPSELCSGAVDDAATMRLSAALKTQADAARQQVRTHSANTPMLRVPAAEKSARRTPEQTVREKLQREVSKQRSLMPLRSFVRQFSTQGLFDVLPVWLLSPETLAVLFPRAPVFDLAVFDEASQCTVANGFPALLRAKRVVIAGDDRQMPPTSFFKAARNEDEPEESDEVRATELLDSESLLTLARQRLPAHRLSWHYRCRDEDLIAFSNHAMYAASLLTCPSSSIPPVPPALRWIAVENAHYVDGRNDVEAERVVDFLHECLSRAPAPTVGIVTFNLTQRRAVLDAVDRRRASDPAFAAVYAAAESRELLDDRPFVKNIESVQGDERDVIVFSLGHAPVERLHKTRGVQRYVPARFGPVGQRGGERRLNVAVSRARHESVVIASFVPEQLSVARAKNDGPRLFKAYLEYAHSLSSGSRSQANHVLDRVRSEGEPALLTRRRDVLPGYIPLSGQIAEVLLAAGFSVAVGIGASQFKLDVALEGQRNGKSFKVALLCDEGDKDDGAYRRAQRATLLAQRGWKVIHVDSLEWHQQRRSVLDRIKRAIVGH